MQPHLARDDHVLEIEANGRRRRMHVLRIFRPAKRSVHDIPVTAPLLNVLYVGEKLVEVVRVKPLRLELSTESLCVKFRIDNYRPFLISEAYVSFHDWKELWVLVFARRPVPINALSAH